MGKRSLAWVGIIFLLAIFIAVFASVLEMRISKGDVYPHYATFRTDPLGASGLYEAYAKLPGITVEKNIESLMKIQNLDQDTTLFLLGIPRSQFSRLRIPDDSPVLKAIEKNGARLVITIDPVGVPETHVNTLSSDEDEWLEKRKQKRQELREKVRQTNKDSSKPDTAPEKKDKKDDKKDKEDIDKETIDDWRTRLELDRTEELGPLLEHRFGIEVADVKKFERPEEGWETTATKAADGLGQIPLWKSQYRFEIDQQFTDKWKIIATADDEPIIAERQLGKGTIVITTDSYFASNESLYNGGDSEFLLWLAGDTPRLIFDETMHGTEEKIGAIKLLREYRLHGFMLGLLVFVVLWAWKSASTLTPGDESIERGLLDSGGTVSGETSKSGFIRLLQRSIPQNELIQNCLATWKSSQVVDLPAEKSREIDQLVQNHLNDSRRYPILDVYHAIGKILKKR